MIKVNHSDIELKALIEKGKSSTYRDLETKKKFLMVLRSFFSVIRIIDNTTELNWYTFYNYKQGLKVSSIIIVATQVKGELIFREFDDGRRIDIIKLKY